MGHKRASTTKTKARKQEKLGRCTKKEKRDESSWEKKTGGKQTRDESEELKAFEWKKPRNVVRKTISEKTEMYHDRVGCQSGLQMGTRQDVACRQP